MRLLAPWVVVAAACGSNPPSPDAWAGIGVGPGSNPSSGTPVPVLVVDPTRDSLAFPLHPELARPCARVENVNILNDGGGSFAVTGFTSTDPAFTMQGTCAAVTASQPCSVSFCFDSTVPGTHLVTGMVQTDIGFFETPIGANVTAPAPDLDLSFHGTGGLAVDTIGPAYNNLDAYELAGGTAIAGGSSLMLWSRWNAIVVDQAAVEHDGGASATVLGMLANWFRAGMRDDGQHVYGVVGDPSGGAYSTIIRFDEAGTMDASFGQIDLPFDLGYYRGLELAPGGRYLAVASWNPQATVVAMTAAGLDATWGTAGKLTVDGDFEGLSAIDSQGRLYLGLGDHVTRLTAAGALDTTFVYTGQIGALAVDGQDRVLVGNGSIAARLDSTGHVLATFPAPGAVTDIAVDRLGRTYVTGAGQTLRYAADGTLDRALGIGSTRGVRCGAQGTCWIYGVEAHATPMEQEFDIFELYALRLAD